VLAERHRSSQPMAVLETRTAGRSLDLVLGAATVTSGLLAGFYYSYACSVMPGLADTDDRTFVEAMQRINDAVENPVFFLSFLGAPVLTGIGEVLLWRSGSRRAARWVAGGLALSAVAFVATVAINVPLNDELARAGNPNRIADLAHVRERFEGRWVAWNIVRTVASTTSLGCLVRALFSRGRFVRS
jgi:uncharacterized membrane protein